MVTKRNLVRVQEKGQVTLPAAIRKRLGIKKGDMVEVIDTPNGILISPMEVVASRALNRMGEVLREQGPTLEDLIESGREICGELIRERSPIGPTD